MSDIVYRAEAPWVQESRLQKLISKSNFTDFSSFLEATQKDPEWFWKMAIDDLKIEFTKPYESLLAAGLPFPKWATKGRINPCELCIDRHLETRGDETAVFFEADAEGQAHQWSFRDLARESSFVAEQLLSAEAKPGDRVALLMPMSLEMIACFFGVWRAGLSVIPIFSGYGEEAILTRLKDAEVKFAFVQEKTTRRLKEIPVASTLKQLQKDCPALKEIFECRREDFHTGHQNQQIIKPKDFKTEDECLILYTSGTTGKPKGCVHTAFGVLATTGKELAYAFDVQSSDRFFWYTDIGWMMGPWELIGCLQLGTPIVLYEGLPNYPDADRLWKIVKELKVTHLGISPTAVRVLKKEATGFLKNNKLDSLRVLGSTGEPWDEETWTWFFEEVGQKQCPIINISGGTEIMGCLLSPTPLNDLKACSLAGPGLGVHLEIWSEDGKPVQKGIGHLVCLSPLPSMTKGFLNSQERYLETYFEKFGDRVWYHGDWALCDEDGFWFLKGRSDDTIKLAGKRVGPNEFESFLMEDERVQESAAIGIPHEIKGECVYCFVVLKEPSKDHNISSQLTELLIKKMGKALAPEKVIVVPSLPKTRSGKILRGLIRKLVLKETIDSANAENPESLDEIKKVIG